MSSILTWLKSYGWIVAVTVVAFGTVWMATNPKPRLPVKTGRLIQHNYKVQIVTDQKNRRWLVTFTNGAKKSRVNYIPFGTMNTVSNIFLNDFVAFENGK